MRWCAFATDFDGTIATDGSVDSATRESLRAVRLSGAKTILVTGRVLADFVLDPEIFELFDTVVAENGAILHTPSDGNTNRLAEAPPTAFREELESRGVPVVCGDVIVATVEPYEVIVLETIKEMALELQVIFNKGAVMILPGGINKATGLRAALQVLGIDASEAAGVGDAENDSAFLEQCGLSVAVGNALPALKEQVDYVTRSNAGAGVSEMIAALLRGELDELPQKS